MPYYKITVTVMTTDFVGIRRHWLEDIVVVEAMEKKLAMEHWDVYFRKIHVERLIDLDPEILQLLVGGIDIRILGVKKPAQE